MTPAPTTLGRTEFTTPDDTSIVITRSFDAPRELVWRLWHDPELIPEFWGPAKHRNEVKEWDLRPGGAWRILSHLAEGGTVDFHGEFVRVEAPELVEWTFGFDDVPPGPETLTFTEVDGITTATSVSTFPTKEIRDAVLDSGMQSGATEMHDRFDALLERHR
jgi:uncharacterized protein YndB with AHSA1/START domain